MFGIKLSLRKDTLKKTLAFELIQIMVIGTLFESHSIMFGESWNIVIYYMLFSIAIGLIQIGLILRLR